MLSLKDHKHPFDLCIGSQTTPLVRGVQCFTPKRGHWSFPLPLAFVQLRIVSSTCGRRNYSPEEYRSNETGSSDGVVHISHSRLTRDPQRSPACAGGDRHRVRTITMRFFFFRRFLCQSYTSPTHRRPRSSNLRKWSTPRHFILLRVYVYICIFFEQEDEYRYSF